MKNRRTIIVAFLLVAVLTIGVGFANLEDTLNVTGTTGIVAKDVFDSDVYFSEAVISSEAGTATISNGANPSDVNDIVTININNGYLNYVGEQVIITLTVKSTSESPVYMEAPVISNTNETYFNVYTTWDGTTQTIPANGTADIVITVELKKAPETDQTVTFGIDLGATDTNP